MTESSEAKLPPSKVIDASVIIALCAQEPAKFPVAVRALSELARSGHEFYAPGVMIAEALYVLCGKRNDNVLTEAEYVGAISDLSLLMESIKSLPAGDGPLVQRAHYIRTGYGCARSNDSIYIALTEQLALRSDSSILTFDSGMENQAKLANPPVKVTVLIPQ